MKQRWQIFSSVRTSLSGLIWRLMALQRWPHHWCHISTWELDDLPVIRFFILFNALKPSGIRIFCLHACSDMSFTVVFETYHWKNYCFDSCLIAANITFDLRCPLWDFEKNYFVVFCGPFISHNNFCVLYRFIWLFWFIFFYFPIEVLFQNLSLFYIV